LEFIGILRDFPKTKYAKETRFVMGKYFYGLKMYYDAIKNFREYFNSPVVSRGLGSPMRGTAVSALSREEVISNRGW